jgi:hypothetical protein
MVCLRMNDAGVSLFPVIESKSDLPVDILRPDTVFVASVSYTAVHTKLRLHSLIQREPQRMEQYRVGKRGDPWTFGLRQSSAELERYLLLPFWE